MTTFYIGGYLNEDIDNVLDSIFKSSEDIDIVKTPPVLHGGNNTKKIPFKVVHNYIINYIGNINDGHIRSGCRKHLE